MKQVGDLMNANAVVFSLWTTVANTLEKIQVFLFTQVRLVPSKYCSLSFSSF